VGAVEGGFTEEAATGFTEEAATGFTEEVVGLVEFWA
jgi:hypothetical protein